MGTVTIGSYTYNIYGSHTGEGSATEYFAAATHAAAWESATDDQQKQSLVTATRTWDRQRWQGEPTVEGQDLAWPRTGVVDGYGEEVPDDETPEEVIQGCYEYALLLLNDAAAQESGSSTTNIKSIKAGSVSMTYFRPVTGGRFPTNIQELVGQFLAGSASTVGVAEAFGTDEESVFTDNPFELGEGLP